MIFTVRMFLERRYKKDFAWRRAWNTLSCSNKPRTSKQQEYIEHRANLANTRIAQLMQAWDLHKR